MNFNRGEQQRRHEAPGKKGVAVKQPRWRCTTSGERKRTRSEGEKDRQRSRHRPRFLCVCRFARTCTSLPTAATLNLNHTASHLGLPPLTSPPKSPLKIDAVLVIRPWMEASSQHANIRECCSSFVYFVLFI